MGNFLFCFGYGYTAKALTRRLAGGADRSVWRVAGTVRAAADMAELERENVTPVLWQDIDNIELMRPATHLLISAAPGETGDPTLATFRDQLAAIAPNLKWVGYLSTTGVYGDHQGGWVDETTALMPTTRRGELRVMAESEWQAFAHDTGAPLHIFRRAGIYGPGRGPFAKVRAGTARRILRKNQVFSRIHVEDIAQVLTASIARPNPGAVYNVCDNDPAPPEDIIAHAAALLGLPVPPAEDYDTAEMTAMARSFYAESKRVSNARITQELGVTLRYPDYRSGLAALLHDSG